MERVKLLHLPKSGKNHGRLEDGAPGLHFIMEQQPQGDSEATSKYGYMTAQD
jgi:hypothetical protein